MSEAHVPPATLTDRQARAAKYLAQGQRQVDVALRVGVSARALRYWMSIPAFVNATRDPANIASPAQAEDVLTELLDSRDERVRLQAATALLRLTDEGNLAPDARLTTTIYERPPRLHPAGATEPQPEVPAVPDAAGAAHA